MIEKAAVKKLKIRKERRGIDGIKGFGGANLGILPIQ